jgi:hypothetical protein
MSKTIYFVIRTEESVNFRFRIPKDTQKQLTTDIWLWKFCIEQTVNSRHLMVKDSQRRVCQLPIIDGG